MRGSSIMYLGFSFRRHAPGFAALGLLCGMTASTQQPSAVQRLLDTELPKIPARAGIWVKHLTTGEVAGVRDAEAFNSASVIKIPVALLAYELAEAGKLSLGERVTLRAEDVRSGSGIFRYHEAGLQPTLRDVIMQMIITSDNTATDVAIGKVGGVASVNAWLADRGYEMKLTQTTGELFAKYRALSDGESNQKTNDDRTYWLGEITPRATGQMLEALHVCAYGGPGPGLQPRPGTAEAKASAFRLSQKSCEDLIRVMRAQQAGARRLPHYLDVPVAHKTGDFPPVLANDVGIVFARSGPVVVSFLLNAIAEPYGDAEDRMGRVTQQLVTYFDRAR
ncbi:MAG: serine hydrolase [Vicinamibacterales bacterium]